MFTKSARYLPLSGAVFTVLVLVGGPVLEGSAPDTKSSGAKVIAFYAAHRAKERTGAIVLAFAFLAILVFASALREQWRRFDGTDAFATLTLTAAAVLAGGQTTACGLVYALTDRPAELGTSTAETLNRLDGDLVITTAIGFLAFSVVTGLLILGTRSAPRWLGWFTVVTGLLFVVPGLDFLGFIAVVVWVTTLSVMTFRRQPAAVLA